MPATKYSEGIRSRSRRSSDPGHRGRARRCAASSGLRTADGVRRPLARFAREKSLSTRVDDGRAGAGGPGTSVAKQLPRGPTSIGRRMPHVERVLWLVLRAAVVGLLPLLGALERTHAQSVKEFLLVTGEWQWKAKPGEAPVVDRNRGPQKEIERYTFDPAFLVVNKGEEKTVRFVAGGHVQVRVHQPHQRRQGRPDGRVPPRDGPVGAMCLRPGRARRGGSRLLFVRHSRYRRIGLLAKAGAAVRDPAGLARPPEENEAADP